MSDKRMWEGKARYVERLMHENARIDTLTEEQHNALEALCKIRHDIHGHGGAESFFYATGSRYDEFWSYVCDESCEEGSKINKMLNEVGLPIIDLDWINPLEYENDYTYEEFGYSYEDALAKCTDLVEKINSKIEGYLKKIDKEHRTQYCPTGIARDKWINS